MNSTQSLDKSAAKQRALILELLKASPQTTYSLRAKGISHGAARVLELKRLGFRIATSLVTAVDSDGYLQKGVALYTLEMSLPAMAKENAENSVVISSQ